MSQAEPLLVIAGPTAAGKSALGVAVAERLDGEIVSADAVAVYRGLDIGSDKPSPEVRRRIPHHLIDIVEPTERYSAGDFAADAGTAIADIHRRRRTPVVVGGSHFYLRALLQGLFPSPPRDPVLRAQLEDAWAADPAAVRRRLAEVDPEAAATIPPADRQRLLRALEVAQSSGETITSQRRRHRARPHYRPLVVYPLRPQIELYARIEMRVDRMFASGLVEEVRQLLASGVPIQAHVFTAIGYRQVIAALHGEFDTTTAITQAKLSSRRLARQQLGWLRNLQEGRTYAVPPVEENGAATVIELWNQHREGSEHEPTG